MTWSTAVVFVALIVLLFVFRPDGESISIDYDHVPTIGSTDAKVKLAEFGDFKCPTCQMFAQNIMPEIQKDYIDKGQVSLSFLNYMIISPQADSYTAALAAQSVYHQNKDEFWKYYEAIYNNQQDERTLWATADKLVQIAKDAKLNIDFDKLRQDIDNETYQDEVLDQTSLASSKQFPGTPTILLNGKRLTDDQALNINNLKAEIDKALAAK
ncbi:DsbA family protein [Cohnella zeiphila]|uniref:Thioredoxin domain-containing protein n=1 Tax=Cohnella zeiphila TaxID=2761120 RepID=A0A7X0SJ85_9BACL|nr:thioredoxin domain-containing protein [Cohnella zeiphila]MBB6729690.1 thioredoxin domain-containing protein [Cohnella zeiphila]